MRLGKTPFDVQSIWENIESSAFGANNGNLVFGYAAHKLFSVSGTTVHPNRYKIHPDMVDAVNDEYDGFVLPLANAFRPSFKAELQRTTAFIEKLKIPFLMLSGGAQLPLDGNPESLRPIENEVKRFARAVLEKSPALSVRGERTAAYLSSLGIKDVVVVGCPSLTLHGPGHSIESARALEEGANVAYNIETSKDIEPSFFRDLEHRFDATYFPQDQKTLEGMLWGSEAYPGRTTDLPLGRNHRQFLEGKAEYWADAPAWIERLKDFQFSVGSRIHGNIAAILAGIPAVLLAHDSRTLELAEHHMIPVRKVIPGEDSNLKLEDIIAEASYEEFNRSHAKNFEVLSDFVHAAGFAHIHEAGRESDRREYNESISALDFPAPTRDIGATATVEQYGKLLSIKKTSTQTAKEVSELRVRERRITAALAASKARHATEVGELHGEVSSLRAELKDLRDAVVELSAQVKMSEEKPSSGRSWLRFR